MTLDQVRALLLARAAKFKIRARETHLGQWCKAHRVSKGHVSEFLNGKRLPTTDILNALGLEWRICRKRKS